MGKGPEYRSLLRWSDEFKLASQVVNNTLVLRFNLFREKQLVNCRSLHCIAFIVYCAEKVQVFSFLIESLENCNLRIFEPDLKKSFTLRRL